MPLWSLGFVFSLVGLPFVWLARRTFARDRVEAGWPSTPGVILRSGLESWTQRRRDTNGFDHDDLVYKPVVTYRYTVDGITRESSRVARAVDNVATTQGAAQRTVDAYPVGTTVRVLFDPRQPDVSLLEVQRSVGAVILLLFGGLWLGIGCLLIGLDIAF